MQVTSITQGYDLVNESLFQHLPESLCNSFMQHLPIRRSDGQLRDSIGQLSPPRSCCFSRLLRLFLAMGRHAHAAHPINL